MARRSIRKKQAAKLRKLIERQPLPAYTDLVRWLKLHGYAQTTGEARKILTDGRVKSDSHIIGRAHVKGDEYAAAPDVLTSRAQRITVST